MSISTLEIRRAFEERFGGAPDFVAKAPGRVNIIGEHTDYNHGFVLPMAIERETAIAFRRRPDRVLRAVAINFGREAEASLDNRERDPEDSWMDYILGVADELAKLNLPLTGADMVIKGDVPVASGLSSSASLEMAALVMFETLGGYHLDGPEGPQLGKRVENLFLGVNSGIMDQFIVRMGKAGHALFLDCRSHEYDLTPVDFPNARFVIANTGVSRGLGASKYNERVAECAEAVRILREKTGRDGSHLRDFELADLKAARADMMDVVYRRAHHVITEDDRTKAARDAMGAGEMTRLGQLMDASDFSLRDDYEVTCMELDAMTAMARSLPGCYGARMTGAGFGGCAVMLVANEQVESFTAALMGAYREKTGLEGEVIISAPADGAGVAA